MYFILNILCIFAYCRLLKYDVTTLALVGSLQGLPDCVSAVHCHPQRPATVGLCTGQRHFDLLESDTERESDINDSDSDSDKMDEIVHELYGQNNNTQNENEIINKQNQFSAVQIWSF